MTKRRMVLCACRWARSAGTFLKLVLEFIVPPAHSKHAYACLLHLETWPLLIMEQTFVGFNILIISGYRMPPQHFPALLKLASAYKEEIGRNKLCLKQTRLHVIMIYNYKEYLFLKTRFFCSPPPAWICLWNICMCVCSHVCWCTCV